MGIDYLSDYSPASQLRKTRVGKYIPLSYRFAAVFLIGGVVPNPFDIKFQKISGISTEISTEELVEGGENLLMHNIPSKITHENLVLERGLVIGSLLNIEFNVAMSMMKFSPSNVLVTAIDGDNAPIIGANWLFMRAYPVKWEVSDLDAEDNNLMIDTMELAYARMQHIRF